MKCENCFCIYQSKGKCLLKKIRIDSLGMCAECIYPKIDKKVLEEAKQEFLMQYEESDKQ